MDEKAKKTFVSILTFVIYVMKAYRDYLALKQVKRMNIKLGDEHG